MKSTLLFWLLATFAFAQQPPKVLIVTAHPDDETSFPVTVFKITHDLKGTVDLALMTDAQGGFNGSELGSLYYGYSLTDSIIGRERLSAIRKQELMNAGRILGIRNYFFFDQKGDLQENLIHRGDVETFRYFAINSREGVAKAQALFDVLRATPYPR